MIGAPSLLIGVGAAAVAALLLSTGTIVQALDARLVEAGAPTGNDPPTSEAALASVHATEGASADPVEDDG